MKRPLIASALVCAMLAVSAGSAFASDAFDGPSEFSWVPQTSALSRAQVRDELIQAQRAGLVVQHDTVYPKAAPSAQPASAAAPVTMGSVGAAQRAGTTYFGS
ncbi:DUF4148 domain-containing protein [Pandoraea nosoerga]|uniref:DUF4148 domain-containing protein n=1 Tax=Pandoraea nosoerga TaxID=2508296 RepID=A0A5E4Y1E7_9BURK|nr:MULTISPECIES: DUF4148 domain-containing protein [Pandoraea]MBN4667948.1 DUF4148 domain-containing protein [Pandoraea nosoerga]MBN4677820.1 DUF4148 domain-containing protein [Pandoraea nosoerga]MBN4682959.1 DUF4148 domain-containing protein [Pandoraea nosoerga]MBN4746974.1 DUF4148 domain-containing protein [Pandoraea nosoerga]VVE42464.1 hypothetical protein PNO31109_04225 [Pandoraea nosoerga]